MDEPQALLRRDGDPAKRSRLFGGLEQKWIVAVVFAFAMFIDILDSTIVNVSLPVIARDLGGSFSSATWVSLGYVLSLAVSIPASGWIGARFGTKRTFLLALAIFTLASAACGQARSLGALVAFRFLQGIGGGMLTPVGTTMLFRAFPPEERARASAILAIPTVLAPASGPVIGGLLTDTVGWRWIFYINLPIGALAFVVGVLGLIEHREDTRRPFDVPGFVLVALAFPAVVFALERGPEAGWASASILGAAVVGTAALVALVRVELRRPAPLLDLRLFGERLFRTSNIVNFLYALSFFGLTFLMPQFLQRVRGLSPFESGLTTFPQAIGVLVTSRIAGRLYHRMGPRRQVTMGLVGLAVVTMPFLWMTTGWNLWVIRILMFVRGFFLGNAFIPLQPITYTRISFEDTGRASAITSTTRQLGSASGVAVLSTVLLSAAPAHFTPGTVPAELVAGFTSAFHWAFGAAIAVALVAALCAQMIRDEDVAITMHPRPATGGRTRRGAGP